MLTVELPVSASLRGSRLVLVPELDGKQFGVVLETTGSNRPIQVVGLSNL